MTKINNGDSGLLARTKINDAIEMVDISSFLNVAAVLADTTMTYSSVVAGDIVRTRSEGFAYQVATSDASDHHVTTAGGVKLYVRAGDSGLNVKAFGAAADGVADDTAKIQAAFNAASAYSGIVFPPGSYKFNGAISLNTNNVTIDFQGATFLVGDTGASGTFTVSGSTLVGKIGFLFNQCDGLKLIGALRMVGQGAVGVTSLAGIVFSDCDDLSAEATMQFEQMSAGRLVLNCNRPALGNAYGVRIDGLQTFETPPANNQGSVEVLVGCQNGRSGDVVSFDGEKPARYMSVGLGRNNIGMVCGASTIEHDGASATSHALSIRSAVDCSFGPVTSIGSNTMALLIGGVSGDYALGYRIDRVYVDAVIGTSAATSASVDSLVQAQSSDTSPIGVVQIGSVIGSCSGEFAIFNDGANLQINSAFLSGSASRLVFVSPQSGSAFLPELYIGYLEIGAFGGANSPVTVGNNGRFQCGALNFTSGPTGSSSIAVRYLSTVGSGFYHAGIHIDSIRYKKSGSSGDYVYLVYDASSSAGPASVSVQHVIQSDATGEDLIIGSGGYYARFGRWLTAVVPATGTWRVGDQVWDVSPVTGTPMGWICSAAGTPGTWRAMANLA